MRTEWLGSIPALRQRQWDSLTNDGDLFRCCDWLDITASSDPELAEQPRYLMVSGNGRPLAASPVYILTPDAIPDPLVRADLLHRPALSRAEPPRDWANDLMPGMICGGWAPFDSRILLAPDAGEAPLNAVLDEIERYAKQRDVASAAFLYADDSNLPLRGALARRGFLEFPVMPRAMMDITWPDFAGYMASLSRSWRQAVRADERRLAEADVVFEMSDFTAADVPHFARLATATAARHEPESDEQEMERWLVTMQEQAYFPTVVVRATVKGQLFGYLLLVEWRGVLYPQHGGMDYELKGKLPIYFGMVFYEPIRYAIERGCHRIEYNVGSAEVKMSRGCVLRKQWTIIRAYDPAVHAALGQVLT